MFKMIFYLIIPFSLLIHPASAKNCGTGMGILWQYGPSGMNSLLQGTYTSADSGYAGELTAMINGDMFCEPDYTLGDASGQAVSRMVMHLNNGTRCKDNKTISIDGVVGVEWQLSGMVCQNNELRSNTEMTVPWDQQAKWSDGTNIGSAKLYISREYWQNYSADNQRSVNVPTPSFGMGMVSNSPGINIGSVIGNGKVMNIYNQGTCSMSLSTENLNFGRLSPTDINSGKVTQEFQLNYSCVNKAAVNGLYLKFEPQNIINDSQGTFSAKDKNGNDLIFKISAPGFKDPMPLNVLWKTAEGTLFDDTDSVNIKVQAMPSSPFPSGSVSTYLNISLVYR